MKIFDCSDAIHLGCWFTPVQEMQDNIQPVRILFMLSGQIRGAHISHICHYTSNAASAPPAIYGIRKIILLMHKSPADTMLSRDLQGLGNGCKISPVLPQNSSRRTLGAEMCIKGCTELWHLCKSSFSLGIKGFFHGSLRSTGSPECSRQCTKHREMAFHRHIHAARMKTQQQSALLMERSDASACPMYTKHTLLQVLTLLRTGWKLLIRKLKLLELGGSIFNAFKTCLTVSVMKYFSVLTQDSDLTILIMSG